MSDSKLTLPAVTVPVESATKSKINWLQVVSTGSMLASFLFGPKFGLTTEQAGAIAVTLGTIADVVTWVLRTWFTKSITPSSVK